MGGAMNKVVSPPPESIKTEESENPNNLHTQL